MGNEAEKMSSIPFHLGLMQRPHNASQVQGNHALMGQVILVLEEVESNEGICQARNPMEEHRGRPGSSAGFVHVTGHLGTGDSRPEAMFVAGMKTKQLRKALEDAFLAFLKIPASGWSYC